jgi:carbonic anhydrase
MNFSNYRTDLKSGVVVFLVALPLCLGIALASGVPLFSGLIAGIIGGIVVGFLSNSQLSVTGPAAGLTAIMLSAKIQLGSVEALFLAVSLAGLLQLGFGFVRLGIIAYYIPSNVIKGMIAAIGLIIILKQIPHAVGYDVNVEGDFSFLQVNGQNTLSDVWNSLWHINMGIVFISQMGLIIMIIWGKFPKKVSKTLPAGLVVVVVAILHNYFFKKFAPHLAVETLDHLVSIPKFSNSTEFFNLFSLPDFSQLANYSIYLSAMTIAIVASIETLLCIEATDKLDPFKRTTDSNRELKAQGIGNFLSGLIGGLPMTSVVVRSSTNIDAGAKSNMSTIFHGILLLLSFLLIPNVLELIPLSSLAVILIITGFKLTKPSLYKSMYKQGFWQFAPFIITIVAILITDLLIGVGIGLFVSGGFILYRNLRSTGTVINKLVSEDNISKIELGNELSFLNKAQILLMLNNVPEKSKLILDAHKTTYIDPDVIEEIKEFIYIQAPSRKIKVITSGFSKETKLRNTAVMYDEILHHEVDEEHLEDHARELQEKMTSDDAINLLKQGNFRFVNNLKLNRNLLQQVNVTSEGQYPYAVILSCMDSRTSVELIFDEGLGNLFSIRIAGNVLNKDILGSMEFACGVVKSKLVVVLGHTKCGAIKGACDHVNIGHLGQLVEKIEPAIKKVSKRIGGEIHSDDLGLVNEVTLENVKYVREEILEKSTILHDLVDRNKIKIVCGMYDVDTGKVDFIC